MKQESRKQLIGPGYYCGGDSLWSTRVRRLGDVDAVAIAGSSQASGRAKKAQEYKVERAYGDY